MFLLNLSQTLFSQIYMKYRKTKYILYQYWRGMGTCNTVSILRTIIQQLSIESNFAELIFCKIEIISSSI